jgi:dTDP-4-amino-4,6-dideoxy-D-galactose acyltransferase
MYEIWLRKSIEGNNTIVLIELFQQTIVGFISLDFVNEELAVIGLIATHPEYQGKGVARRLISSAEKISVQKNLKKLSVATQKNNLRAMKLYTSCGFNLEVETHIYHYWK